MGDAVCASYSERAVEHTSNKNESVTRVSRLVRPVMPDKVVCGVWNMTNRWHNSAYNDSDEHTGYDEEQAQVANGGKGSIGKEHRTAAYPGAYQIADKDVPGLCNKSGVQDAIHADSLIAENGGDGGGTKDPGAGVPPTGEPAANATMTPSCDRRPLIH